MTEPTASGSVLTTGSATTGAQGESLGTGLQISGLNKVFTTGRKTVTALQDANLHTEQGTFLSLLGPSGCGKSTILRILAGLEQQPVLHSQVHSQPVFIERAGLEHMA